MRVSIPFVGPSYAARSLNADAQRAINCFVEMDQASPRAPVALYGTPGLRKVATAPNGTGCRGMISEGGFVWIVIGGYVYRMSSDYNLALAGTIIATTGQVGIASNGKQLLIVDGIAGYIVDIVANTVTQIADLDFPNGVKRATYQDGYFIVTGNSTQSFYISQLLNGGSWSGLDFASAEGSPDDTIGCISDHRELWLFGETSAEVWVNTGNTAFPFERSGNTFIEHGCAAAGSINKLDNTVFWLGADDRGSGIVWRANGYTPIRVSTHALEVAIAGYPVISDAIAFTYQQEGHGFYALTFPSAGATWVYDVSTQLWHERAYRNALTGALGQWRAAGHCMLNNSHIVGDATDGRIYILDLSHYTDDSDPILRLRASQTQSQSQARLFYKTLQLDMETGVGLTLGQGANPLISLRYSNDGGHTWSNYKTQSVGAAGAYASRCLFNRLGAGRNRVWEISMTDPVKFAILGALLDAESGIT